MARQHRQSNMEKWHVERLEGDHNKYSPGDEVLIVSSSGERAVVKQYRFVYDYDQNYEYELEYLDSTRSNVKLIEPYIVLKSRTEVRNFDLDHASYLTHSTLPPLADGTDDAGAEQYPPCNLDKILRFYTSGGYCELPERYFIRHQFPDGMTETQIMEVIKEAYRGAKRIPFHRYSDDDKSEYAANSVLNGDDVLVLYEGRTQDMVIHFWYNYTADWIEAAYPVGERFRVPVKSRGNRNK